MIRIVHHRATLLLGLFLPLALCAAEPSSEGLEFFEKKIRPILAEQCFECHSAEKKVKGGLRLDSRDGWAKGGESGPAIVPGDLDKSRLIRAVRYADPDLQMPPKRKLAPDQIAALERWVKLGAPDPRAAVAPVVGKKTGMTVEEGRKFWAYQPVKSTAAPSVKDTAWPRNDLDRFILARIEAKNLKPAADADRATLARRVYFDLTGLPPTPEQIDEFTNDKGPDAYARLVDRLLASPHFGERWGRHWLDIARYAESITLRGFVLKEAWRYRDYVIESFNADRPFNQFVREQIAGDLLPYGSLAEHRRQLTATAFLALANTNLEEQDKKQLEMDVVDEQLDVISKGFLAQTVACARCHDHKFDPIPTRDYYALAGILKNTRTLEHSNVSKWLDLPLPGEPAEEAAYKKTDDAIVALQARIKTAKDAAKPVAKNNDTAKPIRVALAELPGIVVDDIKAKRVGDWTASKFNGRFVGEGYLHDNNVGKGQKTLTFQPDLPHAGLYEVRLGYISGRNRATNAPVTVFSADGEKTIHINQQEPAALDGHFASLGQYRFEQNGAGFVIISNEGTKGIVGADAVLFVPIDASAPAKTAAATSDSKKADKKETGGAPATATDKVKELEAELKKLTDAGSKRPLFLTVREEPSAGDIPVHVRGSVHNLGEKVPRGFLQVASLNKPGPPIAAAQSGRRELAEWLASAENPLTARVMANRTWHWLFGTGLVRTTDNFGTTGELPSHPELLDHLAVKFVQGNWSVKKLVREIVLSRTYQQGTPNPAALAVDPENRLFSHAERRRLDAECIHDTMLSTAGTVDFAVGGPTLKPGTTADYAYKHTGNRRSVYAPVLRNSLPELFETFDFADPSVVTGRRNISTVAPQALFLMNHPFAIEQARATAQRLLAEKLPDDTARITRAYRLVLGRSPTDSERQIALKHIAAAGGAEAAKQRDAWAQICQALFASPDFRYVN
ncbi:MAG: DUF1553 domain-containing protein [Pedosphaera sp.]|nr:DUF1553 domain-containing protein [Pedosphaera sp.]